MQVEVAIATNRAAFPSGNAVGTIRAENEATLRFAAGGQIESISFVDGERVEAGRVLIRLEAQKERAELSEALAQRNNLRNATRRADEMVRGQLMSRADADSTRASYEAGEAKVAMARAALNKTEIRAPFDGIVGLRDINVGDFASVGQPAIELVDMRQVNVDFRLPELSLERVSTGQRLTVSVDSLPGERFEGVVHAVSPKIDPSGRTMAVRARIPLGHPRLRSGQLARVTLSSNGKQTVVVPEAAIWTAAGVTSVFRVEKGIARLVQVETAARRDGQVEIARGLSTGDRVVVAGQQNLSDGAVVQAQLRSSSRGAEPVVN